MDLFVIGLLATSLLSAVGYMAKLALTKISKLEIAMQTKTDKSTCDASQGKVYQRTDAHYENLRRDINGIGDKFEAKIDKLSDKLTTHIENHH